MEKKDNSYRDLKYILFKPPIVAAGFVFFFYATGREITWLENIVLFISISLVLSLIFACNYRYFTGKKNYPFLESTLFALLLFLFQLFYLFILRIV